MHEPGGLSPVMSAGAAASPRAARWRSAATALIVVQLAIIVLYRDTALGMVQIWTRSETFTHGFLVPPIVLWLVWRLRGKLARLAPRVSYWSLLPFAVAGGVWWLGELAAVNVLAQLALTTMLVAAVPLVLGARVAGEIAFPLAFLYFAVPFGEFALPQLMEWTASFTVFGLRLSGIPVFREGLQFVIPSGNWSVIEACSGVRYLIASLCVGTLFAYLNYRSAGRRLIFVVVAIVVPVVANWLRAYMIVMLGHVSGNRLASGVDHLIYGWIFFGIVICAMFWIGARWREDGIDDTPAPAPAVAAGASAASPLVAALAAVLVAALWPTLLWRIERDRPPAVDEIAALEATAGWPVAAEALSDWTPRFENPAASVQASFGTPERRAGLYLGYYRNQDSARKMVSSVNVLIGSNDRRWAKVAEGTQRITLGQQTLTVRSAELRSSDALRLVAWQWYWVNGHLTSSDFAAKVHTTLARISGQGDDSAVIVVYAAKEQPDGAALLQDFAGAAWPQIERALQRTRERR